MAYWFRKRNRVYVCWYEEGRVKTLPRAKTIHLDGDLDHNIDAWVNQNVAPFERAKIRPSVLDPYPDLIAYLGSYADYLHSRKKSPNTIRWHVTALERYAFPFFLGGDPPLPDPAQWPGRSIRLHAWLTEQGASESTITRINVAVRGFYNFLCDEGRIQTGVAIRLRNPVHTSQPTPLQFALTPEQVLAWTASCSDPHLRLLALSGYFFSLRPQETFALRRSDFRAGSAAEELECSQVLRKVGLYGRLAVKIARQRSGTKESPPKSHSAGWVACFNETAARLIVELIRGAELSALLVPGGTRHLFRRWERGGIPNITLKDLRRASLYWLGHHTALEPANIQKHARHRYLDTTMIYLRRPEEEVQYGELDLDA